MEKYKFIYLQDEGYGASDLKEVIIEFPNDYNAMLYAALGDELPKKDKLEKLVFEVAYADSVEEFFSQYRDAESLYDLVADRTSNFGDIPQLISITNVYDDTVIYGAEVSYKTIDTEEWDYYNEKEITELANKYDEE